MKKIVFALFISGYSFGVVAGGLECVLECQSEYDAYEDEINKQYQICRKNAMAAAAEMGNYSGLMLCASQHRDRRKQNDQDFEDCIKECERLHDSIKPGVFR